MFGYALSTVVIFFVVIVFGMLALLTKFYKKVEQGDALVRNGIGGTRVTFSGMMVIPILHHSEVIDISVKRVTIDRNGAEGLICQDNIRADIKVAFFVRVNKTGEDVLKVAQSIGCKRASHREELQALFEAKFSEALKTVGKQFDFVDLYNSREQFKEEILKIIGTDLNGFILDDAAIDFLEQTPVDLLNENNILDAQGIKKITDLTAQQMILSNKINREKEKTITQQDVEAKEAILELNRQMAEAENRQKREVESVKAREESQTKRVQEEEKLKAETARITTEEEIQVAEQNRDRQVIVASKNKERTEAIETERVEKDRLLEATERERIVELARIEKEKALEVEKKNIQNVIRERVMVQKSVVEEQERIKDTEAFALADREKRVALTHAEQSAEETLVVEVKGAEASKKVAELKAEEKLLLTVQAAEADRQAAERKAEERVILAEAEKAATEKHSEAKKLLAEARVAEAAAQGLGETQVEKARYNLIEQKGMAEAKALEMKLLAEANGIREKAQSMKELDKVGKEHEEFRLRLEKEKAIEIAQIEVSKSIAEYQSLTIGEALKSANVDIVGGDTVFFEKIVSAVTGAKVVDRYVDKSATLSDVKQTFFNADPEYFRTQMAHFFDRFNLSPDEVKNLSISAVLLKMLAKAKTADMRSSLYELLAIAERTGKASENAEEL